MGRNSGGVMAKGVNGFEQFTISKAMSVEKDERKK